MKLGTLLDSAGLALPASARIREIEVTGISSDSRTVRAGEIFVALRGLHHDGCRYVGQALARGAVLAVCERPLEGENVLVVQDARAALSCLLDAWYGHPAKELSLIGVTGTNGKTSTATMLYRILRAAGERVGLIGTVEILCDDTPLEAQNPLAWANMTTPDPAELYELLHRMRTMGARYVVMEVTSHALTFQKVAPLFFRCAIFTNLTPDHLDLHGDMESYYLEKRKLFDRCEQAVISCSTSYGKRLCKEISCPFHDIDAQALGDARTRGMEGVSFTLRMPGAAPLALFVPVAGRFTLENAALAAQTARVLGVEDGVIRMALAAFGGVRGRMERIAPNSLRISVILDYAHTPDALEKLLLGVRELLLPEGRLLLLFGCGGDRDRSKRAEMGRVGSRLADLLILTSDNCRTEEPGAILADILRGVDKEKPYRVVQDRKKAIYCAVELARPGDVLILAGKGHEEYEIKGGVRFPFSEREIVTAALAQRAEEQGHAD